MQNQHVHSKPASNTHQQRKMAEVRTCTGEGPRDALLDLHVCCLGVLAKAVQQPPCRLSVKKRHRQPQHLQSSERQLDEETVQKEDRQKDNGCLKAARQ